MSALYLPETAPQTPPQVWDKADGWIYSWVRTDHPGYRTVSFAGVRFTVASGTYRWDNYITVMNTAFGAVVGVALDAQGRVSWSSTGPTVPTYFVDRLGWLIGLGVEAGVSLNDGDFQSRFVPPGGVPLLGIDWVEVGVEREKERLKDLSMRQGGYVYGGARLWHCPVTMSRWAWEALRAGWCLRGKVTLASARGSGAAMGAANPTGTLTGKILGLDGEPRWLDPTTQRICTATLVVAGDLT